MGTASFSNFCLESTAVGFNGAFEGVFGDIFSSAHFASGMDFVLRLREEVVDGGFTPLSSGGVLSVAFAIVLRGTEFFAVEARGGVVGMFFLAGVFIEEVGCFVSVLGGETGAFLEGTLWRGVRGVVSLRESVFWPLAATAAAVARVFFTASGGSAGSGVCV